MSNSSALPNQNKTQSPSDKPQDTQSKTGGPDAQTNQNSKPGQTSGQADTNKGGNDSVANQKTGSETTPSNKNEANAKNDKR